MGDGGKGSAQRPVTDRKKFEKNWDAIFGKGSNEYGKQKNNRTDERNSEELGGEVLHPMQPDQAR